MKPQSFNNGRMHFNTLRSLLNRMRRQNWMSVLISKYRAVFRRTSKIYFSKACDCGLLEFKWFAYHYELYPAKSLNMHENGFPTGPWWKLINITIITIIVVVIAILSYSQ